jgi:hypothetical protein
MTKADRLAAIDLEIQRSAQQIADHFAKLHESRAAILAEPDEAPEEPKTARESMTIGGSDVGSVEDL